MRADKTNDVDSKITPAIKKMNSKLPSLASVLVAAMSCCNL